MPGIVSALEKMSMIENESYYALKRNYMLLSMTNIQMTKLAFQNSAVFNPSGVSVQDVQNPFSWCLHNSPKRYFTN